MKNIGVLIAALALVGGCSSEGAKSSTVSTDDGALMEIEEAGNGYTVSLYDQQSGELQGELSWDEARGEATLRVGQVSEVNSYNVLAPETGAGLLHATWRLVYRHGGPEQYLETFSKPDIAFANGNCPGEPNFGQCNVIPLGHHSCCESHDQCYCDNGCSAWSWFPGIGSSACNACNAAVVECFINGNFDPTPSRCNPNSAHCDVSDDMEDFLNRYWWPRGGGGDPCHYNPYDWESGCGTQDY